MKLKVRKNVFCHPTWKNEVSDVWVIVSNDNILKEKYLICMCIWNLICIFNLLIGDVKFGLQGASVQHNKGRSKRKEFAILNTVTQL